MTAASLGKGEVCGRYRAQGALSPGQAAIG